MPVTLSTQLRAIRAHEGSQARAWEELAYQLRPAPSHADAETRKTRAPDGGVEWYVVYPDGHEEGFQAKFNESLADALSGMRESVRTVAEKRPHMTRLTFVVPYDFTDSGTAIALIDDIDRRINSRVLRAALFSAARDIAHVDDAVNAEEGTILAEVAVRFS